ncbi:hypothetical protein H2199_001867 [Coniosporium tulheliwenetii]|uniref:Uncharacterized protein n=1 Tax=Coniosporium tulheliwenetii TaxID=3383036 RepID=A0ACC2ZKH7_9PEZI|nr:hypothetical protein H2199_001867 [Cladosporium sp. JES 115]
MLSLATFCCGLALAAFTDAQISLGRAAPFGIVATTAITSTGATIVDGQLGIFPNDETSITGFPPGISGPVFGGDATAQAARDDATSAYTALAALTPTTSLTGQDLGGMTLSGGVYNFASSGGLTGILTLDGQGNPNTLFVFQFGSTLTTASASSVVLINGAQACNVFWQVGSSATLGTTTNFAGNILAYASITGNAASTVTITSTSGQYGHSNGQRHRRHHYRHRYSRHLLHKVYIHHHENVDHVDYKDCKGTAVHIYSKGRCQRQTRAASDQNSHRHVNEERWWPPTSTVTKGKAKSTKMVKTTHTSTTSTYWTTKTTSMTYIATMTPKCTTKAAAVRRYQRM